MQPEENVNQQPHQTAGRLRAFAKSRLVVAGLVALLVYTLSGFFLAPWLVRQQLPSLVEKHLGAKGSVDVVRINPFLLSLEAENLTIAEKSGNPVIEVGRLLVDFEASSLLRWAWVFREIRIERPVLSAEQDSGGNLNLARLHGTAPPEPSGNRATEPAGSPRLLLQNFSITGGIFRFTDRTLQPAAVAQFDPVSFEVHDISTLPDHRGKHTLTARLPGGGSLRWQGKFSLAPLDFGGSLRLEDARLATLWRFLRDRLLIAEPAGSYALGLDYRVRHQGGALDVQGSNLSLHMKDLVVARSGNAAPLGKITSIALEDGRFDLGQRSIGFNTARITDGSVNVTINRDGTPDWATLVRSTPAAATPANEETATGKPWRLALPKIEVGPLALTLVDHSRTKPLTVRLSAETALDLDLSLGAQPQLTASNIAVKLGGLRIQSGDDQSPLVTLTAAELTNGHFNLQQQNFSAGALRLSGGKTILVRDAEGNLNLASAFASRKAAPDSRSAFGFSLAQAEIRNHAVSFTDRTFQPALAYDLDPVRAAASRISMPFKSASPVELTLRVKQGGSLQIKGSVDPQKQVADVRVGLSALALQPAAVLLKRYATLDLASGKADISGRLQWNGAKNPIALRYTGSAAIADVDLKLASGERLSSWKRLSAADMNIDLGEKQITIARIDLVEPYARLHINKDRSTNLAGIMVPQKSPAAAEPPATDRMAIRIDRVAVERGAMDFTDLGLVLPFSTHIKSLDGAISGLSSDENSRASLKLEGRVDEFGLARAEGAVQPFSPKKFTDIAVSFRNVALTSLSPYSATFAGRKIASGKLSLNLEYKLDNSKLVGDNKILLDQFTLGERVESPSAINLPLDLAIALLTDNDGKIDLAVPVSGNVDNPEFSYGHLVWQAIRTVITRIVTAPFRALGALFGGGSDPSAGTIVFDPGSSRLLPTEQEKLRRIADGLQKRPQLKLIVQGQFHKDSDGQALRKQAVRAELARREGLKLPAGEDPGPVAFGNPKTQRALENMLGERAGSDAAAKFTDAFRQKTGKETSRVNAVLALMGRGAGDGALYEAMYQRLIELQPLTGAALTELAANRGSAVTNAFIQRLKFDPSRLGSKPATASDETTKNGVPIKLDFEAGKS